MTSGHKNRAYERTVVKADPYKSLRHSAELLKIHTGFLLQIIDRKGLEVLCHEIFTQAYDDTFNRQMMPYYSAYACFEKADCDEFNESIVCIKDNLEKIEDPISRLITGNSNVENIQESLRIVLRNVREITTRVDQRLMTMEYPMGVI